MWIAFFSQTGSEINNIINRTNKVPDLIITNRNNLVGVNLDLIHNYYDRFRFIPNKPSVDDYLKVIPDNTSLITLHGYLRIIPKEICEKFKIVNLHPGLITKYPFLKGFNPQEKAFKMKLDTSGAVIHTVIPEVDSGEVIDSIEVSIKDLSLDDVYNTLHKASTELWVKFLNNL